MADISKKLSSTARALLTLAATRPDRLIRPPELPIAAARQVVRSMLNAGLIEEVPASIEDPTYRWRAADDGTDLVLQATATGLARLEECAASRTSTKDDHMVATATEIDLGPEVTETDPSNVNLSTLVIATSQAVWSPNADHADTSTDDGAPTAAQAKQPVQDAAAPPVRPGRGLEALRQAARLVLDAWNDLAARDHDGVDANALEDPIARLRAALAACTPVSIDNPGSRPETKQAQVLTMLRRAEGASGPAIAAAVNWAPHTVRGFLAGLAKKGIAVEVLERVRQIGPNKTGAKGSYTVYHIAD
jgi:hypothetical protein